MTVLRNLVFSSLAILLPLALNASAASAAAPAVVLTSGGGCVRVSASPSEACTPVGSGALLAPNSTLVAGPQGAALQLFNKGTIMLEMGAELRIGPPMNVPLSPGEPTRIPTAQLLSGKVHARLPKKGSEKTALLIRGPGSSSTLLKEGASAVTTNKDTLAVGLQEGDALVGVGAAWIEVHPGQVRVVQRGVSTVRPLSIAPRVTSSQSVITSASSEPLVLHWDKVAGAAGYEVLLQRNGQEMSPLPVASAASSSFALNHLPAGQYEASVHAIDPDGIEGVTSAPLRLTVLGVEVPPGAHISPAGAVELAKGQRATLQFSEGLEATFDTGTSFVSVPKVISLPGGNPRLLRVRRQGTFAETRLLFEQRAIHAVVEMSPKTARWPADPIAISIHLVNDRGGPVPEDIIPQPQVLVNVEPIATHWEHEGNVWRAVILPRSQIHPHVLRVEVSDQNGIFLGRSFLEIGTVPSPLPPPKGRIASR